MGRMRDLADHQSESVAATAKRLTEGEQTERRKLERLFYFVRDGIKFAFPPRGDLTRASETLRLGIGQCNTKAVLFHALCKAAGIPSRLHFSLIGKDIQKGVFEGFAFRMLPDLLSHAWIEVLVEGAWRRIDSFINDIEFYEAGKAMLKKRGMDTGYSIACSRGESSADFRIDEERFVQMDAVVKDHGCWDEPEKYFASGLYRNRPNALTLLLYRIMIGRVNRRVASMRASCANGLCGAGKPAPDAAHSSSGPAGPG